MTLYLQLLVTLAVLEAGLARPGGPESSTSAYRNATPPRGRNGRLSSANSTSLAPDPEFASFRSSTSPQERRATGPSSGRSPSRRGPFRGSSSDLMGEDSNIVFPTASVPKPDAQSLGKFQPRVNKHSPNCSTYFCEDVDNYPGQYLQNMLPNIAVGYKEYFGNDISLENDNISQRIDASDENPLCPYEEIVIYPKAAQNKDNKWLYVVNQDHFVQGVRIEKCIKENSPCSVAELLPLDYHVTCKQKYILRKLVALNPEGQTQTDVFRLPSCCNCQLTRSSSTNARSGLGENMSPAVRKPKKR